MPNKLDFFRFKYMQIINIKLTIFRNLNLVLVIYHWPCFFRQFWSIGHDFCSLNVILLYASVIWLIFQMRVICLVGFCVFAFSYHTGSWKIDDYAWRMFGREFQVYWKPKESFGSSCQTGIHISNSWPKSCPLPKSSSLNLYDGQII